MSGPRGKRVDERFAFACEGSHWALFSYEIKNPFNTDDRRCSAPNGWSEGLTQVKKAERAKHIFRLAPLFTFKWAV